MSTLGVGHIAQSAEAGSRPDTGAPDADQVGSTARRIWIQTLRVLGVASGDLDSNDLKPPFRITWPRAFAVSTSVGLLVTALAANASRSGYDGARGPFYLGIVLFFLPV